MSIHKENGRYRVKWRDHVGRQRSRGFDRKGDAELFDSEMRRRRQLGPHLMAELERQTETLEDFIGGPWRAHAATLAPKTRAKYRWVLDNHLGSLGDEPLVTLNVTLLAEHQRRLLDAGVAPRTVREILRMIGGILTVAADHGRIPSNPMRSLRKVPVEAIEPVVPLSPVELETLIATATGIDRAILVLGGHMGLRPIEIRRIPWARLHADVLTIASADTKPSARPRTIKVPTATALALKEWRLQGGRLPDRAPIVGLDARAMNTWNDRLRTLATEAIGRADLTVYTLRHSHASTLHYAGYTIPEAAERMGHTTVVHWNHYAHVLRALDGQRYDGLDALIAAARSTESGEMFRHGSATP